MPTGWWTWGFEHRTSGPGNSILLLRMNNIIIKNKNNKNYYVSIMVVLKVAFLSHRGPPDMEGVDQRLTRR